MTDPINNNSQSNPNNAAMNEAVNKINQDFKEKEIARQAKELGIGYVNIAQQPVNPDVFELVSFEDAVRAKVLPFSHLGNQVSLAITNPNSEAVKQITQKLQNEQYLTVHHYLASDEGIVKALKHFAQMFEMQKKEDKPKVATGESSGSVKEDLAVLQKLGEKLHTLGESMEGLSELEQGALATKASDIHFQPYQNMTKVRFRIDGVLTAVTDLAPNIYNFFATQIKHKAAMKINVNDVPQDGRYSIELADRKVDVRVSSLPTEYGESLVLRLLDSKKQIAGLAELGYRNSVLELLEDAKELSQGMIMVTGPTGSGKSTTLYSLLSDFNQPGKKVITLEDPVEYKIKGIVQSPIKPDKGYTFEKGLESILRQDPDVIMVGEIRDKQTAETSAQAALTGHVVLCTLHTNNAIEAIPRFINMGVKPFIAAPALNIIVAQRLVRKLCNNCKKQQSVSESDLKFMKRILGESFELPTAIMSPTGCEVCSQTGYLGRIVIAEGFKVTETIEELILKQASLAEVRKQILDEQKMQTMLQDGLIKVIEGITTVEEIKRVAMY